MWIKQPSEFTKYIDVCNCSTFSSFLAKEQLREIKSLEKNLALSKKGV
jgi:hypothetical protein